MVISWREWRMMSKNTILTVTAVIASGIMLTSYILLNNHPIEPLKLPSRTIYHGNPPTNIDFKLPRYIPAGYCPYDSWGDNDIFNIVFAPCGVEEPDPKTWITFGASRYVQGGVEYYKEYKAKSDRGELVQLFEINGNPAMGWEVGKKNSITMLDDKIINVEQADYPAYIGMVDIKENVGYGIKAYLPLDELKKIMASLEKP